MMQPTLKPTFMERVCKVLTWVLMSFGVGLILTASLVTLANQNIPMLMLQSEETALMLSNPQGYAEFSNELLWTCSKAAAYLVLMFWMFQVPRILSARKARNS